MTTKMDISKYKSAGDSVSLKKIDGQKFTIVKVEDSNYEEDGKVTEGVKITTEETFTIDGKMWNKFHTTRIAIVRILQNPELRKDLEKGGSMNPVICKSVHPPKGKDYWDLVPAK